jgi:hypothetical protein
MKVHERESIGLALRRFKKLLERSGLTKELAVGIDGRLRYPDRNVPILCQIEMSPSGDSAGGVACGAEASVVSRSGGALGMVE